MTESNMDREGAGMPEEDFDAPTVVLTDDTGRSLNCYIEHSIDIEEQEYVFLLPIDSPVEIFAWQEEGDEEEAIPVEDEAEIERIFPIARAVLQEQNLELKRTAVTLTVEGDLPELNEEDVEVADEGDSGEHEELQLLASFYDEEQEYAIYAPLDPFFILAKMDAEGQPKLLSPEELSKIEPMLPMIEDQLFDEME
ncbi:MAG TPA: DUF3727 domain-containing protein [Candidatus Obscuribacterales bacterium]|uniref:DUF3727 domain-containing protein n=1 Tax=Trichocoleus desertorum TaxID=1481672 RepID=UPI0025B4A84E